MTGGHLRDLKATPMRTLSATALVILLWAASPATAPQQGTAAPGQRTGLTITFTSVDAGASMSGATGDLLIDLGTIVGTPTQTHAHSTISRREFAIRLLCASNPTGMARVSAWLQVDDHRSRVRIDGRLLSDVPLVVDAAAVIGTAARHAIEIEVPYSEPAGPLVSRITWRAERR
jgi:hypothetical protein